MKKIVSLTALLSSALTLVAVRSLGWAPMPRKLVLENAKVRVEQITYAPGIPRDRYLRNTDQVIVFLDDCRYQRKDSESGTTEMREHKAGDAIWHDRGEDAPQLTNVGTTPYRTLIISLK